MPHPRDKCVAGWSQVSTEAATNCCDASRPFREAHRSGACSSSPKICRSKWVRGSRHNVRRDRSPGSPRDGDRDGHRTSPAATASKCRRGPRTAPAHATSTRSRIDAAQRPYSEQQSNSQKSFCGPFDTALLRPELAIQIVTNYSFKLSRQSPLVRTASVRIQGLELFARRPRRPLSYLPCLYGLGELTVRSMVV